MAVRVAVHQPSPAITSHHPGGLAGFGDLIRGGLTPRFGSRRLHGCLDGMGTTGDSEFAVAQGLPAGRADGEGVEVSAAGVLEDDGLGPGVAVAVAPFLRASRIG